MGGAPMTDGGYSEAISQLQNIARNLALQAQSEVNSGPVPTTTLSPQFASAVLSTVTPTLIVGTSALRHGVILHNPGTTAAYIWPTSATAGLSSSALGGAMLVAAGSSVILAPNAFPNITNGFAGISTTAAGAITIWQFF